MRDRGDSFLLGRHVLNRGNANLRGRGFRRSYKKCREKQFGRREADVAKWMSA